VEKLKHFETAVTQFCISDEIKRKLNTWKACLLLFDSEPFVFSSTILKRQVLKCIQLRITFCFVWL
jgi:hypothetical protein